MPQEDNNRDDHHGGDQERRRKCAQVRHQADAPFAGPSSQPFGRRLACADLSRARHGRSGAEPPVRPLTGLRRLGSATDFAALGRPPCAQGRQARETRLLHCGLRIVAARCDYRCPISRAEVRPQSRQRDNCDPAQSCGDGPNSLRSPVGADSASTVVSRCSHPSLAATTGVRARRRGPPARPRSSPTLTFLAACGCCRACWVSPGPGLGTRQHPRHTSEAAPHRPQESLPDHRSQQTRGAGRTPPRR